MKWLRHITPFRSAALAVMIFYVVVMVKNGMSFSRVEGEGMTIIEFPFIPLVLFFIDLIMRLFIVHTRVLFGTQAVGLLALAFWAW